MTGSAVSSEAAISSPQGCTSATINWPSPTGSVNTSVLRRNVLAYRNSFQDWVTAKSATASSALVRSVIVAFAASTSVGVLCDGSAGGGSGGGDCCVATAGGARTMRGGADG